ncbi:MAG: hypothetical protein P1U77_17170 [Rubripirellula sp.]|nr:hypothetical protein [Rubripirellula sp.]
MFVARLSILTPRGDLDELLVALIGVNEHDLLNEAIAFFRLESTTADTLMPPDVPLTDLIGPPSLIKLNPPQP